MNVGARLKEVRQQFDYRLQDAADAAEVNIKLYQAYEAGRCRTPIEVLLRLSEFYEYHSLDGLLNLQNITPQKESELAKSYRRAGTEKRKIIDYILSLNN